MRLCFCKQLKFDCLTNIAKNTMFSLEVFIPLKSFLAYFLTFRVRSLEAIISDIGSSEPAKFSPLVLLKPVTYAVTVGVSDRPGVHDAIIPFLRNYPDSYYSEKLATGIQLYTIDER